MNRNVSLKNLKVESGLEITKKQKQITSLPSVDKEIEIDEAQTICQQEFHSKFYCGYENFNNFYGYD
jgi:hypothetical protein